MRFKFITGASAFIAIVSLIVIILSTAFYFLLSPSEIEVARKTAPNGRVDAVIYETNGGATTSFGYNIYILKPGDKAGFLIKPVASIYGAKRNKNSYGVNLKWSDECTLNVSYYESHRNSHLTDKISVLNKDYHIVYKPGVIDEEAPPGGMHYNLGY